MIKQTTTAPELDLNNMQTAGYLEISPMTFDEMVKMYMKLSKEELAKMLAERDRLGIGYRPFSYPCPYPACPKMPYPTWPQITWSTSDQSVSTTADMKSD